jgi:hypothetical protein
MTWARYRLVTAKLLVAQLRLHLVDRRPLANQLDGMAVPKCVEVYPPTEADAAG